MSVETGILNTKLYRPRTSGDLVPRPRLLERLEAHRERPLTLVSAPAGYGKTTLVNSWLDACDCPGAWVSLDEGDDDLVLFLTYLLAAIETIFPSAVEETKARLGAASLPPLPVLSRSLINELDQIERPFILVLDDVHHIHNVPAYDLLGELLAYPPRPMHLVLISRKDPLLNLTRLRARRQMTEIRTNDLRFNGEETAAFVRQEMGMQVDDSMIATLLQRVEGWVTGLRLLTLSLRHRDSEDLGPAPLAGSVSYVAEYLADEVLESLPQAIQDYVLSIAILDRFCAPLCEAVRFGRRERSSGFEEIAVPTSEPESPGGSETTADAGADDHGMSGRDFVNWLVENDPFLVRLDDQGEWYRYHNLFRDLLRSRLEQEHGPDAVAALHRRASAWFAGSGLISEALHHAFAAGESRTAVRLVAEHRHELLNREQWQRLERWLRRFDRATIDQSPELSITEAWLMNHHALIQEELEALDRTAELLADTDLPPEVADPIRGEVHLLRANLMGWSNRPAEALAIIESAESLLPQEWQYARAATSMVYGFGYAQLGKAELGEQTLLAGLNNGQIGDYPRHRGLLLYALTSLRWTSLDLQGLKRSAANYLAHGQRFGLRETEAVAHYFLGCAHYHLNELSKAENHFRRAAANPYVANTSFYIQAACGLAFSYRGLGRHAEARDLLDRIRNDLVDQLGPLPSTVLQAAQAELALAEDDIEGAAGWAEAYEPQPMAGLQMFFLPQLALLRVLLARNTASSLARAAGVLTQFLDLAREIHYRSALLHVLPIQALLSDALGDEATALASLEEAVRLGEAENLVRVFVDLGPRMASLLQRLRVRGMAPGHVDRILAAFQTKHDGQRTKAEGRSVFVRPSSEPIEPLTRREVEVLSLLAQGLSNKEIAAQLVITKGTVKQHTHHIYQKLGVKNRWKAISKATDLGIVSPEAR